MLDDHDRLMVVLRDTVDQIDRGLARRGVKICQRLVKEQRLHLVHHHSRKRDALLLPAGEFKRRGVEQPVHIHQRGGIGDDLLHFLLPHALVFQRKGDVLADRKPDELSVRILQHGAYVLTQRKNAGFFGFEAADLQAAFDFAGIGKRDQAVDAVAQRALSAAGRADDEHLFPLIDRQVDLMQGRLRLRKVLKGKV
ncbi:hypothetical protein SDC9_110383 [bioreactor metagenome]|uniref:Uncharacterized protein n=1 Tax=bioreactor metagenome TaxID=1076179 RepID=A0A645BJU9_9ZZZZ